MTLKAQIVYNKETENNMKFHMNASAVSEKGAARLQEVLL